MFLKTERLTVCDGNAVEGTIRENIERRPFRIHTKIVGVRDNFSALKLLRLKRFVSPSQPYCFLPKMYTLFYDFLLKWHSLKFKNCPLPIFSHFKSF